MSDISQAIFALWTLRDSKVWPDGAPELVVNGWLPLYASPVWLKEQRCNCAVTCSCEGRTFVRGTDLDAALYRCLRLLQWLQRSEDSYGVFVPDVGIVPWEYLEPDQIVAAAMEIVRGWEDKK